MEYLTLLLLIYGVSQIENNISFAVTGTGMQIHLHSTR